MENFLLSVVIILGFPATLIFMLLIMEEEFLKSRLDLDEETINKMKCLNSVLTAILSLCWSFIGKITSESICHFEAIIFLLIFLYHINSLGVFKKQKEVDKK